MKKYKTKFQNKNKKEPRFEAPFLMNILVFKIKNL